MPLHNSEDHSSGQVRRNAKIIRLLLMTMRRLEQRYLSRAEICNTARYLFPWEFLPDLLLHAAIQSVCHTGLIASDEPDQPHGTFRLTQTGWDFDLEQTWRLIFGDEATC